MTLYTEILLDALMFPEGPRWHQDKLWFTDQHARQIRTVDLNGKSAVIAELADLPGGLGWLPDGRLLVVSMKKRQLLVLEQDQLHVFADLSALASFHCNDLLVDQQGRSYVGNFGYDLHGGAAISNAEIILVTAEGQPRIVATDVIFPNGMAMTSDQQTLLVAETFAARISSFEIQPDGSLGERKLWADLDGAYPDGICLDRNGAIWAACPNTEEVIHVEQGSKITDRIESVGTPYACMLGGGKQAQLFVLTSETDDPEEAQRLRSGRIEIVSLSGG